MACWIFVHWEILGKCGIIRFCLKCETMICVPMVLISIGKHDSGREVIEIEDDASYVVVVAVRLTMMF